MHDNLINNETGEVYDITKDDLDKLKEEKEKNELVAKQNEMIAKLLNDDVYAIYEQFERFKSEKERFETKLKKIFEANGIKSFKNDYFSITYIPAHTSKRVDTELLKKSGLYDEFTKDSDVKESLRVKFRWPMLN